MDDLHEKNTVRLLNCEQPICDPDCPDDDVADDCDSETDYFDHMKEKTYFDSEIQNIVVFKPLLKPIQPAMLSIKSSSSTAKQCSTQPQTSSSSTDSLIDALLIIRDQNQGTNPKETEAAITLSETPSM